MQYWWSKYSSTGDINEDVSFWSYFCNTNHTTRFQDYEDENLWNYNGFEDNYNLENMLYSYFFNEKALEYWKNIFSSDTCEKLSDQDIYKLLNWR